MNDHGYSQQRLRNQTLLKKEAELNSEMACASSVADVAQEGEPSQLQTRIEAKGCINTPFQYYLPNSVPTNSRLKSKANLTNTVLFSLRAIRNKS